MFSSVSWRKTAFFQHSEPALVRNSNQRSYLVNSIGPILCLQTERAVLAVPNPALPWHGPIKKIGSVELNSWLAGKNLQDTPTGWVIHPMGRKCFEINDESQKWLFSICVCVCVEPGSLSLRKWISRLWQTEVVVKANTWKLLQLRADRNRLPEVKGRSLHRFHMSYNYIT